MKTKKTWCFVHTTRLIFQYGYTHRSVGDAELALEALEQGRVAHVVELGLDRLGRGDRPFGRLLVPAYSNLLLLSQFPPTFWNKNTQCVDKQSMF